MADNSKQQKPGSQKVRQVGDFSLVRKLGKGGMGEVWLARQVSLDRLVALKTLSKELAKKPDFVQRFLREARSMAKLDHVNVVKVYAVDSFKGLHFAAIEYIDGASVQDWLNKLEKLPVADAVHIAIVTAEALQHAHDLTMVHRDIKPDNILLTSKGVVKVADFGLAKVLDEDVSMTQSGTGLGTPLYMAPEQARSAKTVDHRSDIYALGATLYHLLTGKLPYGGGTTLELIIAKETGKYTPAKQLRPEIPEKLDLIIDKMMMKEPAHRYKSCAEVSRDLLALGIHSPALTFIDGAVPNSVGMSGTPTTSSLAATAIGNDTQDYRGRRIVDKSKSAAGKKTSRTWYVQYDDDKKHTVVDKLSTGRVLKMINAGRLTPKARCKVSADGTYQPLAAFPEFRSAIEDQLAHRSERVRKEDMQTLYIQADRDEKKRLRWRWIRNKARGTVGAITLLIWLACISAGLVALFFIGRWGFNKLGETVSELTETEAKDASPKATLDADK
ncbi:MAG: serine/threonine-protein kinase [Planctomycetaceae bacterium]